MNRKIKELEFRDAKGKYLFDLRNEFADNLFNNLNRVSGLTRRQINFTNGLYECFENQTNDSIGIKFGNLGAFIVEPKGYIKIIFE